MAVSDQVQWGVLVNLPGGVRGEEIHDHRRGLAMLAAENLNRSVPGSAVVAYRSVTFGEWSESTGGDQWGVRWAWPDGRVEVEGVGLRVNAERRRALGPRELRGSAVVVSRAVVYGKWWVVAGTYA